MLFVISLSFGVDSDSCGYCSLTTKHFKTTGNVKIDEHDNPRSTQCTEGC